MAPAAAIGRMDHHSVTLEFDMGKSACTGHRSKREMAALVALEEYPYGLQAEGKLSAPAGGSLTVNADGDLTRCRQWGKGDEQGH